MVELLQSLGQLNLTAILQSGRFFPSPTAWEDQVFYFLMLDRFSDDQEQGYRDVAGQPVQNGTTPMYTEADRGNAVTTETDAAQWREAGSRYVGGTLKGLKSKIGYLKRLGVTALWISPLLKQVRFQPTYHGYGNQWYEPRGKPRSVFRPKGRGMYPKRFKKSNKSCLRLLHGGSIEM
jgi:hypothetical protein